VREPKSEWMPKATLAYSALGAAILVTYLATFSTMPASDGLTWATRLRVGQAEGLFTPHHLLYLPLAYVLYVASQRVLPAVDPISVMQLLNAAVGTAGVLVLARIAWRCVGRPEAGMVAAVLLGFSYAYWFYLNCEIHVAGTVFLLLAFGRLLAVRSASIRDMVVIGVWHSLAVLVHQENLLFGAVVLAALWLSEGTRTRRVGASCVYVLVGVGLTALCYLVVATAILHIGSPLQFYLWLTEQLHTGNTPQFVSMQLSNVVKAAKGQATAITVGADLLADYWRNHARYTVNARVIALALSTGATGLLLLFSGWRAATNWRGVSPFHRRLLLLCLVWFLAYKLGFNVWMAPSWEEYHITTLPPIWLAVILLLWLGSPTDSHRPLAMGSLLALTLVFSNLVGWILPWRQYGKSVQQLVPQLQAMCLPGDLVLAGESSLGQAYFAQRTEVSYKPAFTATPAEGFSTLERRISEALAAGHRVCVYEIVPTDLALGDMKVLNPKLATLTQEDFRVFWDGIAAQYQTDVVLRYWQWVPQYDFFGDQNAPLIRIAPELGWSLEGTPWPGKHCP
jgi:hypothetical protein